MEHKHLAAITNDDRLDYARKALFIMCATLFGSSALVLINWWVGVLPLHDGWHLMKANTALSFMITAALILFPDKLRVVRFVAPLAIVSLSISSLFSHALKTSISLDTLFASDAGCVHPGRMSIASSTFFIVTAIVLLIKATPNIPRKILRISIAGQVVVALTIAVAGLVKDGFWIKQTGQVVTSNQTILSIVLATLAMLLCYVLTNDNQSLAVDEIGNLLVRKIMPIGITMPIVAMWVINGIAHAFKLTDLSTMVLIVASASFVNFLCVQWIGKTVNVVAATLRESSMVDRLTGVYNKQGFDLIAKDLFTKARRNNNKIDVVYLDLDGLKIINDTEGHDAGSKHINLFAGALKQICRESDLVGRVGGDEFVILTVDSDPHILVSRLEKLCGEINMRFSVGVSSYNPAELESLINKADHAMLESKRSKKDMVPKTPL